MQGLFALEALLSMFGNAGDILALSLLPVSVVKAISSMQPLFVTLYAKIFHRFAPHYFKENDMNLSPILKITGLLLTILGTLLTAGY